MRLNILEDKQLVRLLSRERQKRDMEKDGPHLKRILKEILQKADEFVPSEAGSVLLDDPFRKKEASEYQELVVVASFGLGSKNLLGLQLPVNAGVVGETYLSGKPYLGKDQRIGNDLAPNRDRLSRFKTRSIICAPIIIESSVCGVVKLTNRKGREHYNDEELKLLEIFAGYTSTLIQNVLYARAHVRMSQQDGLTGLYNDRTFYTKLDQEIRAAKRHRDSDLVVLFLDLDAFKGVNDEFGHLTGSRVLHDVGKILKKVIPAKGNTVARYGGDEFIALFSKTDLPEAMQVAEALSEAVLKFSFKCESLPKKRDVLLGEGRITCSIGLVSLSRHVGFGESTIDARHLMVRKADMAMYQAKLLGKNHICVAAEAEGVVPSK